MRFSKLAPIMSLAVAGLVMPGMVPVAAAQPQGGPRVPLAVPGGSFIGVGIREVDSDRAKTLKIPEEAGVEVTHVEMGSPAEMAGLRTNDVVLQYNGQRVEGIEQFSRMVRETPPGRQAKLSIIRNGTPQTLTVRVGVRQAFPGFGPDGGFVLPAPGNGFGLRMPDMPRNFLSWRSTMLGVEAEALDGQLAQYFGVRDGVLVRSVLTGSAAEKAGIKAGDVITKVDDHDIKTPEEISNRLRSLRGKPVPVGLVRERKEMTLTVPMDQGAQPSSAPEPPGAGARRVNLVDSPF